MTAVIGINVRSKPSGASEKLAILLRGSRVEIDERSKDGKWGRVSKVIEGRVVGSRKGIEADESDVVGKGWLFLGELDPEGREPHAFDKVVALPEPTKVRAGDLIGHLGEYQQWYEAQATVRRGWRPLLHLEVFSGDDVPRFVGRGRTFAASQPLSSRKLLLIDKGCRLIQPAKSDVLLSPDEIVQEAPGSSGSGKWVQVRRGRIEICDRKSLGAYDERANAYAAGVIWTRWYVGAIDTQRTQDVNEARRLRYERREVWRPDGKPLWVRRADWQGGRAQAHLRKSIPGWTEFPLNFSAAKLSPAVISRVLSRDELIGLPNDSQAADPEGNHWWLVAVRTGADGAVNFGWVCEKGHENASWNSPWAWPGFDWVQERGSRPVDMMTAFLHAAGRLDEQSLKDFKVRADKVERSPLVQKLYEYVDRNKDNTLDAQELRLSLKQPLLAESLSRIIAWYESEWAGGMTKWEELNPLMLDGQSEWSAEKRRIEALQWWPEVAEKVPGFPVNSEVFHFHPIGLVANFFSSASSPVTSPASSPSGQGGCACSVGYFAMQTTQGEYRVSKESFEYILSIEKYKAHPYVPGGVTASGITIGYGYDLGHQVVQQARAELVDLFLAAELERLLAVVGKKQEMAKALLAGVSDITISKEKALILASRMKARYAQTVVNVYPEAIRLHPHCQGALLSLVINRGNSLKGDHRLEMKQIQDDLKGASQDLIPSRFRNMKRVWEGKGQSGLIKRREDEAVFFERGLKCNCKS